MPYIPESSKTKFSHIRNVNIEDVGELNYCITELCRSFIKKSGLRYATLNSVVGVLESAKLEFYRRLVASYEDIKISENGDVYD